MKQEPTESAREGAGRNLPLQEGEVVNSPNPMPVHRDDTGILWRIALDGDEDVVMVEVVNSTPEPDGTNRTYWLRVPPTTRTAREGVAWTFGLAADAYEPVQQT
ncbi:DUF6745 domain-containing protein [Nocardia sp. NPDC055053]